MSIIGVNVNKEKPNFEAYNDLKENLPHWRRKLLGFLEEISRKLVDVCDNNGDIESLLEEKNQISEALIRFDEFEKHLKKIEKYYKEIKEANDKDMIYQISKNIMKEKILLEIMFYKGYDDASLLENGYRKIKKDGKVGVAAPDGTVIIPAEYDDVLPLENGYRKVEKDDKDGLADSDALPLDNLYRKLVKDGKAGVADSDGIVIIPVEYDRKSFSEMKNGNLPYVEKRLRGIMSKDGVVLHKAEYERRPELLDNGYAVVKVEDLTREYSKSECLLNDKGELVISGFATISPDSHGLLEVSKKKYDKWTYGRYTFDGKAIIPCDCVLISEKIGIEGIYKARRGKGDCLIKNDGTVIFDSNEFFKERKNSDETYNIDTFREDGKGELKVATISISSGDDKNYGLINENGKVVIFPKYDTELLYESTGRYSTTKKSGGLLGIINKERERVKVSSITGEEC